VAVARSSSVDDVMFSYDAANGLESKTMRAFGRVREVAAPEAKFAISACIFLLLSVNDFFTIWTADRHLSFY